MYIVPGAQSCEHSLIGLCSLFTQSTDHEWKHGFFLNCLTPVLTTAISAQPHPYQKILDVDKIIRDFSIPPTLDIFNLDGIHDKRQLTMQQVLVSSGREIGVFASSHVARRGCTPDVRQFFSSCTGIFLPRP